MASTPGFATVLHSLDDFFSVIEVSAKICLSYFLSSNSASEEEVKERAAQWDQPVTEYVELAERHLGFQQPGSVYRFADAGDGHRRVCACCYSSFLLAIQNFVLNSVGC